MSGLGYGEVYCPKCESDELEHGEKEWDEGGYVVPVKCLNCNFEYKIDYWVKYGGLLNMKNEPLKDDE